MKNYLCNATYTCPFPPSPCTRCCTELYYQALQGVLLQSLKEMELDGIRCRCSSALATKYKKKSPEQIHQLCLDLFNLILYDLGKT